MKVTIQKIAEKAGVSRGTVDRALNHRGRINPEVEERILKLAEDMGYVPRKKRTPGKEEYRIGVVTQLARYSFMKEVNRGIRAAAKELRLQNVTTVLEEGLSVDEDEQLAAIDRLVDRRIDALALMPVDGEKIRERINYLVDVKRIPVLTFNTDIAGTKRTAFVGMDNNQSGRAAAGLMNMLTRGTGKLLVITGFFGNRINSMRVDGFVDEIKTSFPGLEIAGVQSSFDDAREVEKIIINSMLGAQAINGILIVSAGQEGIDSAFQKLQMDGRPYVITYDLTSWSRQALKDNSIDFLIDQDGYYQGYASVRMLSDMLLGLRSPEKEYYYTDISIRTRYNV